MFGNNPDTEERGQVGIGTLIVFIALVLVAAIAAGVLINTAGFLQSQAEATGEESTGQVSNNLNVVSTSGFDFDDNDDIENITIAVGKAPGSDPIDLQNVEIQWVNGDSYVLQAEGASGSTAGQEFAIQNVQGAGDNVLSNESDRAEIRLDTTGTVVDTSSTSALSPGGSVTLTLTTADGAQTTVVLTAPDPLEDPTEL